METFELVEYLAKIAPALVIAAYGFWIMLGLYKDEIAANREQQNYIRESDKKNLEILKDFKTLLGTLISSTETNSSKILTAISTEATAVKSHVDDRIDELDQKIKNNIAGS